MAKIEEKVQNLLEPIINRLGYDLYDVIYTKEGKDYYLRIFIDKHFLKNLGKEINIKLYRPINNKREFRGLLNSFENGIIALQSEEEILKFELKDTVSVNTVFNFEGGNI